MDTTDEEAFLRDLVKASRQRLHHVKWVDRDGTERLTTLTQAEVVRLNVIAQRSGTSKAEVLRRAAFVPNRRPTAGQLPRPLPEAGQSPG